MLPIIPKPPLSRAQKRAALFIAGSVDILQLGILPTLGPIFGLGYFIDDALDFIAAIVLTAVCGFKWQFGVAFLLELLPVFDVLPTWTAVVMLLPSGSPTGTPPAQRVNVTVVRPDGGPGYSRVTSEADAVDAQAVVISTPPPRVPPVQVPPAQSG